MIIILFAFLTFSLQGQNGMQRSESQAKTLIDSLYLKLTKGADFETLANQFSEDPGTRGKGGKYPTMKEGSFTSEFESQVLKLQPMQISEPFKSPYGYHIAQLLKRRGKNLTVRHILIQFTK
jgi:peptidyl-prolyl cis-trans isomerase SurA